MKRLVLLTMLTLMLTSLLVPLIRADTTSVDFVRILGRLPEGVISVRLLPAYEGFFVMYVKDDRTIVEYVPPDGTLKDATKVTILNGTYTEANVYYDKTSKLHYIILNSIKQKKLTTIWYNTNTNKLINTTVVSYDKIFNKVEPVFVVSKDMMEKVFTILAEATKLHKQNKHEEAVKLEKEAMRLINEAKKPLECIIKLPVQHGLSYLNYTILVIVPVKLMKEIEEAWKQYLRMEVPPRGINLTRKYGFEANFIQIKIATLNRNLNKLVYDSFKSPPTIYSYMIPQISAYRLFILWKWFYNNMVYPIELHYDIAFTVDEKGIHKYMETKMLVIGEAYWILCTDLNRTTYLIEEISSGKLSVEKENSGMGVGYGKLFSWLTLCTPKSTGLGDLLEREYREYGGIADYYVRIAEWLPAPIMDVSVSNERYYSFYFTEANGTSHLVIVDLGRMIPVILKNLKREKVERAFLKSYMFNAIKLNVEGCSKIVDIEGAINSSVVYVLMENGYIMKILCKGLSYDNRDINVKVRLVSGKPKLKCEFTREMYEGIKEILMSGENINKPLEVAQKLYYGSTSRTSPLNIVSVVSETGEKAKTIFQEILEKYMLIILILVLGVAITIAVLIARTR